MTINISQPNTTESGCDANWDVIFKFWFYSNIVCSISSFAGNISIILTVCLTKTMRTTTNYFVVNMAVSDIFVPALDFIHFLLFVASYASAVTQTLGTILCKIIPFLIDASYGVSVTSLVVITVYRLYAVVFPMRARLETRRARTKLLFCTWLLPITVCCPHIYYYEYVGTACYNGVRERHYLIRFIFFLVFFVVLPFLLMLILYPVIIVKLVRQKAPGNSCSRSQVKRRREQNISLTKMFITIIVTLLLTYGTYQVAKAIVVFSQVSDPCTWRKILLVVYPFLNVFHAINPVIYFIFCSSYRQGIKKIFFSCCRQSTVRRNPPGVEQIELENVPQ